MKMKKLISALTFFLVGYSSLASAEVLVNPVYVYDTKESGIELFLGKSFNKYSAPLGFLGKTDNSFFSGSYVYGFGKNLNVYGSAAFIFDSSLEASGLKLDGDGLAFGLGLKGEYEKFNFEDATFAWYTQILKANEDLDYGCDGDGLEITAGVLLKKQIHKRIIGYAGLEYVLNSDITFGLGGSEDDEEDDYYYDDEEEDSFLSEVDGERKDKLGIKLGLIIPMDQWNCFIDAGLMNELSLKIGFNYHFGGSRSISHSSVYKDYYGSDKIKRAQQKLHELGYEPGPIDGIEGDRYQNALLSFQKDSGLLETGSLNEATLNALGLN